MSEDTRNPADDPDAAAEASLEEGVAYDAANTNVLGRFVSLQLTRSW